MKVIVDIPDEKYEVIKSVSYYTFPKEMKEWGLEAIRNGTQLPKGHGRLIDADATLKKHCVDFCKEKPSCYEDCGIYDLFHLAPTIIEADNEEEDLDNLDSMLEDLWNATVEDMRKE